MSFFGLLPLRMWLAVAALTALFGAIGVQTLRLDHAKSALIAERGARAIEHAQAEALALKTSETYRAKEQAWQSTQKEITDATDRKILALRADAADADRAAGRLRNRVAALVAQARAATRDPATTAASAPADDPIGLLANLQRMADQAAGTLARVADERGAAGQACELSYDALTK